MQLMRGIRFKQHILPHLGALGLFIVITLAYMSPVMQGETLQQQDIKQWRGMTKQARDFNENNDDRTFWTTSMFGGMPTYQMLGGFKYNTFIVGKVQWVFNKAFPGDSGKLFLLMSSFYFMLLVFGISPLLAIIGGLAYAFCANTLISLEAGHGTKVFAMGFAPLVVVPTMLVMRQGRLALGGGLMAFFLALEVKANHPQITYYLGLFLGLYMLVELISAIREQRLLTYAKGTGILVLAAVLAFGANAPKLGMTLEYSEASTRGSSPLDSLKKGEADGLSKDYVLSWSYGIKETANLLIPNFTGGSSSNILIRDKDSETRQAFAQIRDQQKRRRLARTTSAYWGQQPMTSGPVYLGAVTIYLFVLSLFLLRGPLKWWIVATVILSIMLAWGKNFMPLSSLFYNYFPLYSKFRTVTMILFLVQLSVPLLGLLGLRQYLNGQVDGNRLLQGVKYAFYITGGFCLLFAVLSGVLLDFTKGGQTSQALSQQAPGLLDAIQTDRKALLQSDAWRSFIFIGLTAGLLFILAKNWLRSTYAIIGVGVLLLVDLWMVNKRYVNEESFQEQTEKQAITKSRADQQILQDQAPQYRVLRLQNPFNDATTSYYHRSVGGYHGAKMGRYQELIDYHLQDEVRQAQQSLSRDNIQRSMGGGPVQRALSPQIASQFPILNMLNTKYFIAPGRNNQEFAIQNPERYGNAWFVENLQPVPDADQLILKLGEINPEQTALYNTTDYPAYLSDFQLNYDPSARIELTKYEQNELKYQTKASSPQFAVFSEIYYNDEKGWKAYIDGERVEHMRVNYVLRGMKIPEGEHTIHFKFEPTRLYNYERVALASSLVILFGFLGGVGYEIYRREPSDEGDAEQPKAKGEDDQPSARKRAKKSKKASG